MAYDTVDGFKDRTTLPSTFVDELVNARETWMAAQLEDGSAWIDAQLAKRYAVPFADPAPRIVCRWLAAIVTMRCWIKRGFDPEQKDVEFAIKDYDQAVEEIKQAADSEVGLFELPLRSDTNTIGVSKGGPFVYSEQSPYVWMTRQACVGREEDRNGQGSGT